MARRTPTGMSKNTTKGIEATGSVLTVAVAPSGTFNGHGRPTWEQIAARAEEIYKQRCRTRQPGDAVSDWLKAEAELNAVPRR